jgi:hypothetical protein
LARFPEFNDLTGKHILIIAPRVAGTDANRDWFLGRIRDAVMAGEIDKSAPQVRDFLNRQQEQTYRFAEFIKLDPNELPVIVFFDRLRGPRRYMVWSLKDLTPDDVVDDLRAIVGAVGHLDGRPREGAVLDMIASLYRRRALPRIAGKIITVDLPKALGLIQGLKKIATSSSG